MPRLDNFYWCILFFALSPHSDPLHGHMSVHSRLLDCEFEGTSRKLPLLFVGRAVSSSTPFVLMVRLAPGISREFSLRLW